MKRIISLMGILLLVSACQALGGGGGGDNSQSSETNQSSGGVIQWDKDPLNVVFRADITGGDNQDAFFTKNEIPPCTVYGDGRVVWTSTDTTDILFDFLSDQEVVNFVSNLTIQQRFYTYQARRDVQLPENIEPVVETLTLNVNDLVHQSDSYSAWPPNYFSTILELCQNLSDSPTIFLPEEAWISIEVTEYDSTAPTIYWEPDASGLSIREVANAEDSRMWIEGQNVGIIWNVFRTDPPDTQFNEDGFDYFVALEIPGVTRDAPPAP